MSQVNVSLPSDGTTADVADYNTPITALVDDYNGNIDNSNIASDAAIAGSKLADNSVTSEKQNATIAFRAYNSSATTVADASFTKIAFQTEDYDQGSDFDNATNYRFTAPVAGVYHFDAAVTLGVVASMALSVGAFYVDGVEHTRGGGGALHSSNGTNSWGADIKLTAGQYVEVFYYQDSAGTEATTTGNPNTRFSGHLIGAV